MQDLQQKCDHLVTSYKKEKIRRKTTEKEVEKLKQNCSKLESLLKLYGHKAAPKHTRSQENTLLSPPRKKKGTTVMQPCDEIEYIQSDPYESNESTHHEDME